MENDYQKELFRRLLKSPTLERQRAAFGQILREAIWWISDKPVSCRVVDRQELKSLEDSLTCDKSGKHCLKRLKAAFTNSQKTRQVQRFTCPPGRYGFCLP